MIETGAESETGEIIQTFENVSNFIKAASRITQETFSTADLCSPDGGDRIIQCLLALQDWAQNRNGMLLDQRRFSRSPTIMVPSPSGALSPPTSGGGAAGGTHTNFSFTPHAQHVVAKHGTSNTADGVSYLMRSCNFMMKSHMGMPTTPLPPVPKGSGITSSEIALDAVGPVLETVIQNLTTVGWVVGGSGVLTWFRQSGAGLRPGGCCLVLSCQQQPLPGTGRQAPRQTHGTQRQGAPDGCPPQVCRCGSMLKSPSPRCPPAPAGV